MNAITGGIALSIRQFDVVVIMAFDQRWNLWRSLTYAEHFRDDRRRQGQGKVADQIDAPEFWRLSSSVSVSAGRGVAFVPSSEA